MKGVLQFVCGLTVAVAMLVGLPTRSQATPGSLSLDGLDDYVASQSAVNITTNQITLEAWVYPTATQASGSIMYFNTPPNRYVYLGLESGGVWFVIGDPAGVAHKLRKGGLVANQWHHLAATYDGSIMRLYINGTEVTTFDVETDRSFTSGFNLSTRLYISLDAFTLSGQNFHGPLDEIRVWDYARSAAQISAARNSTLQGTESGLVLYYPFDDGNLTQATDATGHGYDGQLRGGPVYSTEGVNENLCVNGMIRVRCSFQETSRQTG